MALTNSHGYIVPDEFREYMISRGYRVGPSKTYPGKFQWWLDGSAPELTGAQLERRGDRFETEGDAWCGVRDNYCLGDLRLANEFALHSPQSTLRRYVVATDRDRDAGLIWSTGGVWSHSDKVEHSLMTRAEAELFAARHPGAVIVDWPFYGASLRVFHEAFIGVLRSAGERSPEQWVKANIAGFQAQVRAGYIDDEGKLRVFSPSMLDDDCCPITDAERPRMG